MALKSPFGTGTAPKNWWMFQCYPQGSWEQKSHIHGFQLGVHTWINHPIFCVNFLVQHASDSKRVGFSRGFQMRQVAEWLEEGFWTPMGGGSGNHMLKAILLMVQKSQYPCKSWEILSINWCRISSINSILLGNTCALLEKNRVEKNTKTHQVHMSIRHLARIIHVWNID